MLRLLASIALSVVAFTSSTTDAIGVCYSPFYSSDYTASNVASLLSRDFSMIAAQGLDSVRTYHAQFFGVNVVNAAITAGIKIAIGIQMQGPNGGEYAYLQDDIQAAVWAAKTAPNTVQAIYVGNENLKNGNWGSTSADRLVQVISQVKLALQGTAGANVQVGTVQRLEEWLHAPGAAQVAAACDVAGANIYPVFTAGGAADMQGTLARQWSQFTSLYGLKARLTESGWPSDGPEPVAGNTPSLANAAAYFAAFQSWAASTSTGASPFYFMMFDVPSAPGPAYEQYFGIATSNNVMKFKITAASNEMREFVPATVSSFEAPTQAPTPAPTEAPTTVAPTPEPTTVAPTPQPTTVAPTPEPTTVAPTPEPTTVAPTPVPTTVIPTPTPSPIMKLTPIGHHGSSSGSHGGDDIHFPADAHTPSGSKAHAGSKADAGSSHDATIDDGSAGVVPAPTTKHVPATTEPVPTAAPVVPAGTTLSPQAQADIAAKIANSKVAEATSGAGGAVVNSMMAVAAVAGVAAMIVAAVYMRRQKEADPEEGETRTVAASSIDPRGSTPSVYDDPLGTRFSSIVMLTPNGDGVCIL